MAAGQTYAMMGAASARWLSEMKGSNDGCGLSVYEGSGGRSAVVMLEAMVCSWPQERRLAAVVRVKLG